ncbi:uncharacterized protein [Montipora capricornis]|uniref:uncharacterized protein isoform X2 n=1 Tax=Montipora capricornis TaxID=246305 RepID=UPI0035F19818
MSSGNRGILRVFRRAAKKAKNFRLFTKRSSFEGFFASKGAAYALPDGDFTRRASKHGGEMQHHLQAMVNLLRDEDVLRLVVKLECQYPNRIRYLTIVSAFGPDEEEQSIVMGVDWMDKATIGLVVPLYRDTTIKLDGDGGFKMSSADKTNIFRPISVQTMWTALQWIHKCSDIARKNNYFHPNGSSHAWVQYYYTKITSDRICLNEWHQMDDIESRRPDSPIGTSPEKELVMKLIRHKLREVMMKVDLEEVTTRQVRTMLEEDTQMDLKEYRSFIDEEIFTILGQMDSASKIFDHVYLGSEWNASNLEELKENRVGYILNITREIDNFFPGTFCYHNIRVYDLDETELLHHWDNTYKFIQRAKNAGSNVLVHCRMGISRSASTVIAYGMKEYGWSLGDTMKYVKARRSVVQPNQGFWKQLITYEGILNSSKQRYNKLFTKESEPADTESTAKRKKLGNATNKTPEQLAREEGAENVHDLSIEAQSVVTAEETANDSGIGRVLAEDTGDLGVSTSSLPEKKDGDSSTNSPFESSDELVKGADSLRILRILGTEKTSLHRVRSVPTLASGPASRQESDISAGGNFQRSNSLRERGQRNVEQLRIVLEGKSISDESMTEFSQKMKGSFKPDVKSLMHESSRVETETNNKDHGSLPRELHGVLESGFVKRESRKFEEGVYSVPSVEEVLEDKSEGVVVEECNACEGKPRESTLGEEPEPGVVKKHKEEYELKQSQSLKRGAVYQRDGSVEESTLKREKGEVFAGLISKDEERSEADSVSVTNIDALAKKANEDIKQEVSMWRNSKKGFKMQAFGHQEGELIEDSFDSNEAGKTNADAQGNIGNLSNGVSESIHKSDEFLETALPIRRNEASVGGTEGQGQVSVQQGSVLSDERTDCKAVKQGGESILQQGLVKRHTLLIEERLQPIGQIAHKQSEGGIGDELTVDNGGNVTSVELTGEPRDSPMEIETFKSSFENDTNASSETSVRTVDAGDSDNLKGDSEMEDIPQRGLVKRHTLLIEGWLNPLEQVKDAENEISKDDCKDDQREQASYSESVPDVRGDVVTEVEVSEEGSVVAEGTNKCDLLEDRQDKASEEDFESILQKGLVKRHTLLIEGRLQPSLTQEMDDERKDEPLVHEETDQSTPVKEAGGTDFDSEQLSVGQDVSDKGNEPSKTEGTDRVEERGQGTTCEQDTDLPAPKGLVKRHTLLIEGRLHPFDQDVEGEDSKLNEEARINQEACTYVDPQRYQVERATELASEEGEEEKRDELRASGVVKREKMRIEERVNPAVGEASFSQQEDEIVTGSERSSAPKPASEDSETCRDVQNEDDDTMEDKVEEKEQDEVGVDTSSVVRVKDHTQHLEGIIRITTTSKDIEKPKHQALREDLHGSTDKSPKIVIIPRSSSDYQIAQRTGTNLPEELFEGRLEEILSESAVNIALMKAQESLDLENETFVDWNVGNVKQRTRAFEEVVGHLNNGSENPLRRSHSLPRTIHPSEKYAFRRRSFSDVSEIVSSSSGREVGYTIQFSNGETSSSSTLPLNWSHLQQRQ